MPSTLLLWLDDERPAPPGWLWVKTARQALAALKTGHVTYASLDCDLESHVENGVWLVQQMALKSLWPKFKPGVHSSNWKLGSEMLLIIRKSGPYDEYAAINGYVRLHA